jgi:hypothetical protein
MPKKKMPEFIQKKIDAKKAAEAKKVPAKGRKGTK